MTKSESIKFVEYLEKFYGKFYNDVTKDYLLRQLKNFDSKHYEHILSSIIGKFLPNNNMPLPLPPHFDEF